jgi:zinc transporter ZupT
MVIAFPIAISSGSKWKGWTFGALAGMAEPIGALVVSLLGIDLKSL